MQSFAKLSLLLCLLTFGKDASSQSTSSLYYPGVPNAGGVGADQFILASVAGSSNGTTTFVLAIGSTNKTFNAGLPSSPTVTIVEASNTAHLFGSYAIDLSGDSTNIDLQCNIEKDSATCKEVVTLIPSGTAMTMITDTSTFSESVSSIPVTLVTSLPSTTPAPSSPAAGGSNPNSSPSPPPKGGAGPANQTGTSTTPGSSPTNPPNGASHRTVSAFLCAVPVVAVLSMII